MIDQLSLALDIANKAHKGQTDKSGKPYIAHVKAVIAGVSKYGKEAMIVAALHDVIEDSSVTIEDLIEYGFSDSIVTAVKLLTKTSNDDDSYYKRIKTNSLARVVKISDLEHNSDTSRLSNMTQRDIERTQRYISRLKFLKESVLTFEEFTKKDNSSLMFEAIDEYDKIFNKTVLLERPKSELTAQPWDSVSTQGKSEKEVEAEITRIYTQAADMANGAKSEFVRLMQYAATARDKVLVDIKSYKSFLNKAIDRNKPANRITDFLRGAILCPDKEEVDSVVTRLRKASRIVKYEFKAPMSGDKLGYYGSHHFDVEVGGFIAEIQVMTRKLWTYKGEAHKIYNVLRSARDGDFSKDEIEKISKYSRDIFFRGNRFSF